MKTKKLNALKVLGATIAASAATSVAVTLASCSNTNNKFDAIGGDIDREFNVSQATYKALVGQFTLKLRNKLSKEEKLPDDQVNLEMSRLSKSLNRIDKVYNTKDYGFSVICNLLVEKARRQYGIKLITETKAQWSDINKMFYGMKNSLKTYMLSQRMDRKIINVVLEESDKKFDLLINGSAEQNIVGIKQKYDDPLSAMIQAKANIISCFDEVNTDIALLSAMNRLKQFMDDYTIGVKSDAQLDALETAYPGFSDGNYDLTADKAADKVFHIIRNSDNTEITNFSDLQVPGYKITPILVDVSRDPIKNEYGLNVDWTCEKVSYTNKDINAPKAVAHLFKNSSLASDIQNYDPELDGKSLFDILTASNEKSPLHYSIKLSPEAERQALYNTYISKLNFGWNRQDFIDEKNCYESFYRGLNMSADPNKPVYRIDSTSLAESGLTISVKPSQNSAGLDAIRLDQLLSTSNIIGDDSTDPIVLPKDEDGDLVNNFLENCDIQSIVNIKEQPSVVDSEVSNDIIIYYKNTTAKNDDASWTLDRQTNSGFVLSKSSYAYLTTTFNKLRDAIDPFTTETTTVDHALDEIDFELALSAGLIGLFGLLGAIHLVFFCKSVFKKAWYFVCLGLNILSWLFQAVDLGWTIYKWINLHDYAKKLKGFMNSDAVVSYSKMLSDDAQKYSLTRAQKDKNLHLIYMINRDDFNSGYSIYNNKSWSDVKSILNHYQNLPNDPTYINFNDKAKGSGVSKDDFDNLYNTLNGWSWRSAVISIAGSLGCDIICQIIDRVLHSKEQDRIAHLTKTHEGVITAETSLARGKAAANAAGRGGVENLGMIENAKNSPMLGESGLQNSVPKVSKKEADDIVSLTKKNPDFDETMDALKGTCPKYNDDAYIPKNMTPEEFDVREYKVIKSFEVTTDTGQQANPILIALKQPDAVNNIEPLSSAIKSGEIGGKADHLDDFVGNNLVDMLSSGKNKETLGKPFVDNIMKMPEKDQKVMFEAFIKQGESDFAHVKMGYDSLKENLGKFEKQLEALGKSVKKDSDLQKWVLEYYQYKTDVFDMLPNLSKVGTKEFETTLRNLFDKVDGIKQVLKKFATYDEEIFKEFYQSILYGFTENTLKADGGRGMARGLLTWFGQNLLTGVEHLCDDLLKSAKGSLLLFGV